MMTTMMMMSVVVSIKRQHTPGAVAAACNQAVQVALGRFAHGPGGPGWNAQSLPRPASRAGTVAAAVDIR